MDEKDLDFTPEEETAAQAEPQPVEDDRYLRLAAEYDNFRKRTQRERDSLSAMVKATVVGQFLPVYDNLLRAESADDQAMTLLARQFEDVMRGLGVTEIAALDLPFDPNVHDAVAHMEDPDLDAGVVVEVFQKGFMLGDRVIRPAMVKVAN